LIFRKYYDIRVPRLHVIKIFTIICRDALFEYAKQVKDLGDRLFELLSESLGLKPSYLTDIECNQGQIILGHYYPPCPQPELAIGTSRHSDSGFLTILLQDRVGGLQILHGDQWVDVTPTPGAFIVNIADLLQVTRRDHQSIYSAHTLEYIF
jgi:isopenicillin N synthase-like dioxygenase